MGMFFKKWLKLNQGLFMISLVLTLMCWCRWSAYVVDGKVKALNIEKAPSEIKVSGADVILDQI